MKKISVLLITSLLATLVVAQEGNNYSNNPLNAKFVTDDVDRFWKAFSEMEDRGVAAFEAYIQGGTPGLQGFIPYRIINADSLYSMVKRRQEDYLKSKPVLKDLNRKEKRIKSIYAAMKYWYPYSKFPPVYFVVGRFNSGGTVSDAGIILGAEMQKDLEGLPGLVAHELIHFQQRNKFSKSNVLTQSLIEGSADFIGELISGENINAKTYEYGDKYEMKLRKEFVQVMNDEKFTDWLYGTSGKDDRPNDLGYWIGYKIVKSYFDKQTDKQQAILDVLYMSDPYDFLFSSGYLDAELKTLAEDRGIAISELLEQMKK